MDSTAPEPQFAIPFYGLQSKKRNLSIQRNLENCSKRLKDEKIPNVYHSRILGPSARWQTFYRQNEALDFVRHKTEDLHVFAFECRQPDKQSGQRQFLTATYDVFWHYYMQLSECQRHHYEVIPEGHPCKLYFDLEFHKPANPAADGEVMVDTLIKYVCCWLRELYGVQCDRDTVLELSASTETKFSRHLIFQLEGSVFRDNVTAGEFVHAMFGLLEGHLDGKTEHANNNINNNNNNRRSQEARLLHNKAHGTETADTCHSAGAVVMPSPSPAVPSPSSVVPSAVPSPSSVVPSPSPAVPSAVPSPSPAVPSAVPSPSTAVPSPSPAVPSPSPAVPSPSSTERSRDRGVGDACPGDCGGERWGGCRNSESGSKAESCASHGPEKRKTRDTASCGSSAPAHCCGALPAADLEGCACEATDTSPSCSSPLKDASPCIKAEHGENPPECTAHREKKGPCAHKEQTFGRVGGKHAPHSENITCKWHDREEAPSGKKTAPILGSVGSKASRDVSGAEGREGGEGREEESAAEGVGASRERMRGLQGRVWSQLEAEELSVLVVRDREGRDTCFADLGVYTKNRNFRLYKSCKLGKTTAFSVSENSTYTVTTTADDAQRERQLFLASLITSVRGGERLLTFGHRARGEGLSPRPGRQSRSVRSDGDAGAMPMGGCGGSPYPEVDAFISGQVGHGGGWTRRWSYFPPAQTLSYDIAGYRFCHRLQRQHRSNNIRLVADLRRGVWYQRCYDPDCQAGNFRSEEFKLPDSVLPASYFTEDFEEADDNIDDDDKNVDDTMDDDDKNVDDTMDDDDEVCLLAVQQAEQDLTSAVGPN